MGSHSLIHLISYPRVIEKYMKTLSVAIKYCEQFYWLFHVFTMNVVKVLGFKHLLFSAQFCLNV